MTTKTKTPRKSAPKTPQLDREALMAERDDAVQEALHGAMSLESLTTALRRAAEANVRLRVGRADAPTFEHFSLRLSTSYPRGLALQFRMTPSAESAPYVSLRDMFEGLPMPKNWGYENNMLKHVEKAWEGYFALEDDRKDDSSSELRFNMFELQLTQLAATEQAWRVAQESLVAQEKRKLQKGQNAESAAFARLEALEAEKMELEEKLAELEETLNQARGEANKVKAELQAKVAKTAPPVLVHLNNLRKQLGLEPHKV